jgi:hypothetical protein
MIGSEEDIPEMRRVTVALGLLVLGDGEVTGTGSEMIPSNMTSALSHKKKVVSPTNHALANNPTCINGNASVYGPLFNRKWAVKGRRNTGMKGSWYNTGNTTIRPNPNTKEARGIQAVVETSATKNDTRISRMGDGDRLDMPTHRKANLSFRILRNRNERDTMTWDVRRKRNLPLRYCGCFLDLTNTLNPSVSVWMYTCRKATATLDKAYATNAGWVLFFVRAEDRVDLGEEEDVRVGVRKILRRTITGVTADIQRLAAPRSVENLNGVTSTPPKPNSPRPPRYHTAQTVFTAQHNNAAWTKTRERR